MLVFLASVAANSAGQSTSEIIQSLEPRDEPKCYAISNPLEDFMFGTLLFFAARAEKNLLQHNLVADS